MHGFILKLTRLFCILVVFVAHSSSLNAAPSLSHPSFIPKDEKGQNIAKTQLKMSDEQSCDGCHDFSVIKKLNSHHENGVEISCLTCHDPENKMDFRNPKIFNKKGEVKAEYVTISETTSRSCRECHGLIVDDKSEKVTLPPGLSGESVGYNFTRLRGTIFSGQRVADSNLKIVNKERFQRPWDLHASHEVGCVDCHHSAANPRYKGVVQNAKTGQIRATPTPKDMESFVEAPDHRFTTTSCDQCHDVKAVHPKLPHTNLHLQKVACAACHITKIAAPAVRFIDRTVLLQDGSPAITYAGVREVSPKDLSLVAIKPIKPALISFTNKGVTKITPANMLTVYEWQANSESKLVDLELLREIYFEGKNYRAEIIKLFDADQNGVLAADEMAIKTVAQQKYMQKALAAKGRRDAKIVARVESYPLYHGISPVKNAHLDCHACHTRNSSLSETYELASFAPVDLTILQPPKKRQAQVEIKEGENNELVMGFAFDGGMYYLPGLSGESALDDVGFFILTLTFLGVGLHAILRYYYRHRRHKGEHTGEVIHFYPLLKRIWHWLTVLCILTLILSGTLIHMGNPATKNFFAALVYLHMFFAAVLIAGFIYGIIYHIATRDLRQFIPQHKTLVRDIAVLMEYYLIGIFKGAQTPIVKTPDRRLNPLQQVIYFHIYFVLVPCQILTGFMLWYTGKFPESAELFGGIRMIAPIHSACTWLFAAFVIGHVYMTTTGKTVFQHIKAMLLGYERDV